MDCVRFRFWELGNTKSNNTDDLFVLQRLLAIFIKTLADRSIHGSWTRCRLFGVAGVTSFRVAILSP